MSLAALNSPPLISAITLGCYGLLPVLKGTFVDEGGVSWTIVKGVNILSYGLSLYSVSQPGRYDSDAAEGLSDKAKDTPNVSGMKKMGTGREGRTLVPPAGWAFVIWAPIYIGEFLMVTSQLTLSENNPLEDTIRKISGPYLFAQVFQTLWTASFRPKYNQGFYKYVSALNLAGIAFSLSFCHDAFATGAREYSGLEYVLYFLPLALHFGWTSAASIVNVNGMYAMDEDVSAKSVAWLGHASVALATLVGVSVTLQREAPVYGGVICWALSAVASGLSQRIQQTEKEDTSRVGVYGVKLQRSLSLAGAACCALASAYASL